MATETEYSAAPSQDLTEPKKSRGCLYGCLFAVFAVVGLALCAGIGGWWFVTGQVAKYTAEMPVELPVEAYTEEQMTELHTRVDTFKNTLDQGDQPEQDLVLSAADINAMINENEEMQGKAFVKIADGAVSGDVSVPTDALPGGKGRFFNASATFKVSMENGVLIVTLVDAEVKGEKVPQQFIDSMSRENLAKDLYKDPKNAEMLRRFESAQIEDGQLILKLRREPEINSGDSNTAAETPETNSETPNSTSEPAAPAESDAVTETIAN